MAAIAVIRHLAFENLGILENLFTRRGDTFFYIEAPAADFTDPRLQSADLLVILGAPIGAFDEARYPFLNAETACIRTRIEAGKPTLGICLGAQLIARILGAAVAPMGNKEIGFSPLALTEAGTASPLRHLAGTPVLHWHGDQFEIPPQAAHLAASAACPHQAFSVGTHILALQFHLEADPAKIEYWLVGHACELAAAGIDLQQLRDDAARHGQALQQAAEKTISEWLDQAR
ncbi:glutamine amidotransferase [Uruburuella testudinis]|uniref:Glutamine amidotransferase n=1 Tax=Uruburuella testudinis TaxID=1282863 RepID=A0ABY4DSQ0_9NEIS|nr:glutamine amidotransferase [Uruburuella testudinis]UOO82081.1 glutamine amidotransferase [Uruburuella testudinis]